MEVISLKMEENLLNDIDKSLKNNRYSTRTEFIRDAIRFKLSALEKEEAIKKLTAMRGAFKGKIKISDKEAGELAIKKLALKHGVDLD